MAKDESTEQRILTAARRIFFEKGLAGARMDKIAEEAEINKAMLHYYFKSKQKLFDRVFQEAFMEIFPRIGQILGGEGSVEEKLHRITAFYLELLRENPQLPIFVLSSIQADAEGFSRSIITDNPQHPAQIIGGFMQQIQKEVAEGKIRPVDPRHLLLNLIAMSVFPHMLKPVLTKLLQVSENDFGAFIEERKTLIPWYLMQAIQQPED
jgi:AcrR family transcriptional regulator